MKYQIVTLQADRTTLAHTFKAGEQFRLLGTHGGSLVRLSRVSDKAKLTTDAEAVGLTIASPLAPKEIRVAATVATNKWDAPHSDESGPSRCIVVATILAGADSGRLVIHLTPAEEREYNAGMAKLAEWG